MSRATPALSIFPLRQTPSIAIASDIVFPNAVDIATTIRAKGSGYNGHPSLHDAFLAALPQSLKRPEYEAHLERLYTDVKRAMLSPTRSVPKEHWALLG